MAEADVWALSDLCTPWCIHVAVTLRIAERIESGVTGIAGLAEAAGCDRECLHQVLGHLVSKGVFDEPAPGIFALNGPARALLDPGTRLGLDLNGVGGRFAHIWATLPEYVLTGAPAYREVFGRGFWEDLDAHPDLGAQFDEIIGPAGHGTPCGEFAIAGGWDGVRHVVDVGGGTGGMLCEVLKLRPGVRGTLVDQPRTVARSASLFEAAGVGARASAIGQSFFDPLPTGADIYILRGILNDWPDREAVSILTRCAEAARPNGRVVILKSVGPDGVPKRLMIEMILCGGRQRSVSEFTPLVQAAGLRVVSAMRQPNYFVVECEPTAGSPGPASSLPPSTGGR